MADLQMSIHYIKWLKELLWGKAAEEIDHRFSAWE